ncbi:MAG: hypothetical protein K8R46_00495 [Pirellulales bacterium]|nr:hypothetical protein [Pirellulales bacterium]
MNYKPIAKSVIIKCVCLMIILVISIQLVLSENQSNQLNQNIDQNITENYHNTTTSLTNQSYIQPIDIEFYKNSFSWLSLLAAFGPLIAALIAYFTLRELKIQRELSDDPKIYIISPIENNLEVSLLKLDEFDTPLPIKWEGGAIESLNPGFIPSARIPLEAVNTGLGTAFNVNFTFKFEHMSELLNNIDKLNSNIKYRLNEHSWHEISIGNKSIININPSSFSSKIEEPFIFPYSSIQNKVKIFLPDYFLFLASIALASLKMSNKGMEMLPFPSLVGIIEYSDLGGTNHKSEFKVKLDIIQIASKKNHIKNASFQLTVKMKQRKSYITDLLNKIFGKIAAYLRLNRKIE